MLWQSTEIFHELLRRSRKLDVKAATWKSLPFSFNTVERRLVICRQPRESTPQEEISSLIPAAKAVLFAGQAAGQSTGQLS